MNELELDRAFWGEANTNGEFLSWFLSRTRFAGRDFELIPEEKWHQRWYRDPVTGQESETDITLFLRDRDTSEMVAVHIENKPAHRAWEPSQAQNYATRAANRMAAWGHSDFSTALIAPAAFVAGCLDKANHFDVVVTYEDIGAFIDAFRVAAPAATLSALSGLRVHLLSQALDEEAAGQWGWLAAVRLGSFDAIPHDICWDQSFGLARLVDGYRLVPDVWELANLKLAHAQNTGVWRGSASELWASLFFEHRRAYLDGYPIQGDELRLMDALCLELRRSLVAAQR